MMSTHDWTRYASNKTSSAQLTDIMHAIYVDCDDGPYAKNERLMTTAMIHNSQQVRTNCRRLHLLRQSRAKNVIENGSFVMRSVLLKNDCP